MAASSVTGNLSTLIAVVCGVFLSLMMATTVAADETSEDVENFRYASWQVHYDLSVTPEGRAQAAVSEELTAQFPDVDQNRGIIRSLPLRYQSAPAAPEDISVTDGSGNAVPFEVEDDGGFRSILIGDDSFVHGTQTYVISYTVDDVMHATPQADEFYWDLIPVDRQQDIDEVTARITLDETLSAAATGDTACYRGTPEDSHSCAIETTASDDAAIEVMETDLPAGQGLTVAIGVEPGTIAQPPERQESFVLDILPLILAGAAGLLAAGGSLRVWRMLRRYRDDTSHSTIQYGIPDAMNPLIAKWIAGRGDDPITATLLDLAVRGVVRIEEDAETVPQRAKKPQSKPVLRLVDPELATDPLEAQLLEALFPGLVPGALFTFPKNSKAFTKTAQQVLTESGKAVIDRGYQRKQRDRGAALTGWIALALLVPVAVLLIMGASRDNTTMMVITIILGVVTLILAIMCVVSHRVVTPKGAAMRRQLLRMRDIMTASEDHRPELLQSFANAPRTYSVHDEAEAAKIIQVYDRFLPYAVLFGKHKDWSQVLSDAYQHHNMAPPFWYPALLVNGASGVQSSLDAMLSSVSSAAATSSSGAGATGGGVAGGGGGGGAAGGR